LGAEPDRELLKAVYVAWIGAGHNADNANGILDWYEQRKANPEWQPYGRANGNANAQADQAWQAAVAAAKAHGRYQSLDEWRGIDDRTREAVRRIGKHVLCNVDGGFETGQLRKEFIGVYNGLGPARQA
jgi:hypothetical protein